MTKEECAERSAQEKQKQKGDPGRSQAMDGASKPTVCGAHPEGLRLPSGRLPDRPARHCDRLDHKGTGARATRRPSNPLSRETPGGATCITHVRGLSRKGGTSRRPPTQGRKAPLGDTHTHTHTHTPKKGRRRRIRAVPSEGRRLRQAHGVRRTPRGATPAKRQTPGTTHSTLLPSRPQGHWCEGVEAERQPPLNETPGGACGYIDSTAVADELYAHTEDHAGGKGPVGGRPRRGGKPRPENTHTTCQPEPTKRKRRRRRRGATRQYGHP